MPIARYHSPPKKRLCRVGRYIFLTIKATGKLEFADESEGAIFMAEREKFNCPKCNHIQYFEGLCYACRIAEERIVYQSMSEKDIKCRLEKTIQNDEDISWWEKYADFLSLLAYHDVNTEKVAAAAFRRAEYYPPAIYRNASAEVRDGLIALLMNPDCTEANNILQALAFQGDDRVLEVFRQLGEKPLKWQENLHVPPSVYAEIGGWTFDANGDRLPLIYDTCYYLTQTGVAGAGTISCRALTDICPNCGSRLIDVLSLDCAMPELAFLGIGDKIHIPVCPNCAGLCEQTIVRYEPNGESTMELVRPFAEKNYCDEDTYAAMTSKIFKLSDSPVPKFFALGCDEVITIGGMPEWIQDTVFKECPDCGKKMKLLAAIPWSTLDNDYEGTLFAEICTDCKVISLFHQQT
jgi:hypothetical protein